MDLTPQQQTFLKVYLDPKSPTWGNALQSALKAGYAQEYAENITHLMPNWLSEAIGQTKMVQKAERNLDLALEGMLDEEGKKKDIQWKATDFTLSRLKKDYEDKSVITLVTEEAKKVEDALGNILND